MALFLTGCRVRTTLSRPEGAALPDDATGIASAQREADEGEADPDGEPGGDTRENPDADRREFDENANVEIVPGTERALHGEGEGGGAFEEADYAAFSTARLTGDGDQTATETVPAEESERMGVSDEAEKADSALVYFTVLLADRMGDVYECQRLNAYWETVDDHVTIHKSSPEHQLLLGAGVYDVSARLLPENLLVDDGWISRKNPGAVVKVVPSSVLGGSAASAGAAKGVYDGLLSRPEWSGMDAVKNGRVLLISEELLEAPYLQTAAQLMIAKTAMPALFGDVDLNEALSMLIEEATGALPTGVYFYDGLGGTE